MPRELLIGVGGCQRETATNKWSAPGMLRLSTTAGAEAPSPRPGNARPRGGDTKTRRSRRRLRMPNRCVEALRQHRTRQAADKAKAGARSNESNLVFTSTVGTPLDAHNVRRAFRSVIAAAGLVAQEWTPREMRHSFVSLLSDSGLPIEHISRLVGHSGRPSPRPSTAGRSAPSWRRARRRWIASSPATTLRSHSDSHPAIDAGATKITQPERNGW